MCVLKKENELFSSILHYVYLRYGESYNRTSMTSAARHARFSGRRDSGSG